MSSASTDETKKGDAKAKLKVHTPEQMEALKRQFELNKAGKGLLPLAKVRRCLERAKIMIREQELGRMIKLADIVCDDEDLLTFSQLVNLSLNRVDVNMLHKLFNYANTNTELERVEFYLDGDEIFDLFTKLGLDRTKAEIEKTIDELDNTGDRDGRIDWEEFLSICSVLLGASIGVDESDPDGTDFNQLRDSTSRMKENLQNTKVIGRELMQLIKEKKAEIEKRIKDTALEDIRKMLKKEWDLKDVLELGILDNKKANFEELSKLLKENDTEKDDLKKRFVEACGERDQMRRAIDDKRKEFRFRFKEHFSEFTMVMDLLEEIAAGAKVVTGGLLAVNEDQVAMEETASAIAEFEVAPKVSVSSDAKDFVKNQSMVIQEIKTKMQMMQQERDKYEDMIAVEMELNKEKLIECVQLNMNLTNLESEQLGIESKYQEQSILSSTLQKELDEKMADTEGKKVKALRNTVFQFNEEKTVIVDQVDEVKMKLRNAKKRYAQMNNKVSQLNIELGELKILLDFCVRCEVCPPGEEMLDAEERAELKVQRDVAEAKNEAERVIERAKAKELAEAQRKAGEEARKKDEARRKEELAELAKKEAEEAKNRTERNAKRAQRDAERMTKIDASKPKRSGGQIPKKMESQSIMRVQKQNFEQFAMEMDFFGDEATQKEWIEKKEALKTAPMDVKAAATAAETAARMAFQATYASFATLIIVNSAVEVAEVIRASREAHGSDSDWSDDDSDADPVWMALRNSSFNRFNEMDADGSGALDRDEMLTLVSWITKEMRSVVGSSGLSENEAKRMAAGLMDHVDDNDDGQMDFEEFFNYVEEMRNHATTRVNSATKIQAICRGKNDRKKAADKKAKVEKAVAEVKPEEKETSAAEFKDNNTK